MITDTHTHLDFEDHDAVEGVVERAVAAGVTRLITVGTELERSRQGVAIANRYPNVWSSVGIHPDAADTVTHGALDSLRELAGQETVVAIGETGLDLYHAHNPPLEVQRNAFRQHADLARSLDRPLIIHSRQAADETLASLEQIIAAGWPDDRRGVVHCFEGEYPFASALLDLGYFISFTANITYPKNEGLRDVVRRIPLERLMVETDAPFLPPQGQRGERNQSANARAVAEKIAEIKGVPLEEVARQTSANAETLFGLTT